MPSLAKRVRKRFTLFLLVFSCIQLPEQPPPTSQYRLATEESSWNGGSDPQLLSSLLSPQFIVYGLVLLGLLVLGLLATVDLVFKTVFIVCSLTVHWATSHCRIQRSGELDKIHGHGSPSRVSIRIHGVGEGGSSYLLPNFPCQLECGTIYSRVSHLLGVPSALLTLSTGVKILRRRVPLQTYTSDLDLSNGLTLYCCISLPGGGRWSQRPTIEDLLERVVPHLTDRIHSLEIQLGLVRSVFEHKYPADIQSQTLEVFQQWLTRGENCTWKSLIEALRSIYYIGLARKLEDWLNEAEAMKEGEVVVPVIGTNKGKPVYLLDSAGQPAYFDLPSKAFLGHDSSLLAEAMKEGEVVVPVIKVILVGTAGVGKTCVYRLLMGLPPPMERDSTGCATRSVRVVQIISGEEGEKWKEADLKKMLAEAVPILCGRLRKNAHKKESTDAKEGTDDTEGERGAKAAERKSEVQETDEVPKPEKSPLEKVIEEIVVELDKLVRDYEWRPFYDMQQLSLEKQAIYLTDSGGQQAFWDLVPIFICGPLTVLFVHRLCDKLGDKPLNEWYKDGKPVGQEGQRATLTTAEVFKLMCQGLESGGKSNVIVIGTHKDVYEKEEKPTENIKYKNEQFESCIPQDSKVYVTEAMDRVIFEVDTTLRVDENKAIAGELRKVIVQSTPLAKREDVDQKKETEESTGNELEPIPISWYVLQIVLEEAAKRLKREVLLVSECETMAKELSFRDDEVKAALRFFDKLNIFFYKESILPGVVFISSQVPLGCVTKLVQMRYKLLESKEKPSKPFKPTKDMWLQFRDHAKITRDLLKEIFEHHCHGREHKLPQDAGEHKKEEDVLLVEDIFTEKELLLLLNKLLIVAPTNKPLEYFCPALLEMVEVDGFLKKDDRVTRVVQFPGGYAPAGVFCCAVCYLQSKGNWKIRESDAVARNQVTFAVKGRLVTFTDKFQYFAVSIDQKDVRSKLCKEINKDMSEAIENALVATNKKTVLFKLSFLCPCTVHKALHPATVEQDDDEFNLVCSKESLISGTLNEYQKTWLESHSSGAESEPNMIDLSNKVLPKVSSKIMLLAIQLGLEPYEFETIKKNNPQDVQSQTLEVFTTWKQKAKNYTWGVLFQALRSESVKLNSLANELESWLSCKN